MEFLSSLSFPTVVLFILIGSYSCYTDLRYRKIKNWLIGSGILAGTLIYFMFYVGVMSQKTFLLNYAAGILIAYLFWKFNIWAAGDAKFFILSSIFISIFAPLKDFINTPYDLPIVFMLLINAFVLGFIFIFLEMAFGLMHEILVSFRDKNKFLTYRKQLMELLKPENTLSHLKLIFFYIATIIFFMILKKYLQKIISIDGPYQFIFYLPLIFLYSKFRKILKKIKIIYLIIILSVAVVISGVEVVMIIKFSLKFFIILGLIRAGLNSRIRMDQTQDVSIEELKPNVILSRKEVSKLPNDLRSSLRFFSDGLTSLQVDCLKEFYHSRNKNTVSICNTFPFVPFIVLSALFTCILGGGLISPLYFLY